MALSSKLNQFKQKAIEAGYDEKTINAFVQKRQAEGIAGGGVPLGEIQADPTLRGIQLQQVETGTFKPKLSAAEEKKVTAKSDAEKLVSQLEKAYYGASKTAADDLGYGRLGGLLASGKAAIGSHPALKTYQALVKSSRPTLARSAGNVGNLTEPEQKAAVKLLPGAFSTPEEASLGFAALREKFGLEPKAAPQEGAVPGLARAAIPETLDFAQKFMSGDETVKPKGLEEWILPLYMWNKAKEIGPMAGEVATAVSLVDLLGGLKKKGAAKFLKNPRAALAEGKKTAAKQASGVKISTNKILAAGEKYVESDPSAVKHLNTITEAITSAKDPSTLLKRMDVWKKAYTSAGRVSKSSKAGLFNTIYRTAKTEMAKKAPEVMKQHNLLKLSYQVPKTVGKTLWTGLKLSGLAKMLGL